MDKLKNIQENDERLIIATGRYLGEGFDDTRLDTLLLTLLLAWRGPVLQYAGRLHRNYEQKSEVIIYKLRGKPGTSVGWDVHQEKEGI
jgi:superfamily II DNA or RNA helicase